jgi:hypothetical protein
MVCKRCVCVCVVARLLSNARIVAGESFVVFSFLCFSPRPACAWARAPPAVSGFGRPSCDWTPPPKLLSPAGWPYRYTSISLYLDTHTQECLLQNTDNATLRVNRSLGVRSITTGGARVQSQPGAPASNHRPAGGNKNTKIQTNFPRRRSLDWPAALPQHAHTHTPLAEHVPLRGVKHPRLQLCPRLSGHLRSRGAASVPQASGMDEQECGCPRQARNVSELHAVGQPWCRMHWSSGVRPSSRAAQHRRICEGCRRSTSSCFRISLIVEARNVISFGSYISFNMFIVKRVLQDPIAIASTARFG